MDGGTAGWWWPDPSPKGQCPRAALPWGGTCGPTAGRGELWVSLLSQALHVRVCFPSRLGGGIIPSPAFPQKASEWCVSTKGERCAPRSLLTLRCTLSAPHGWMDACLLGSPRHPSCKEPAGGTRRW